MTPRLAHALLDRLYADVDAFTQRFVARMQSEIPTYAQLEPAALVPATAEALSTVFHAMREGRAFTEAELATFADHGEVRGRQGLSLDEVFAGWHVASRMVLDDLVTLGRDTGVSDGDLLDLSHELLRTVDGAMLASASGHHRAEFEIARLQQDHRADLVRGILFGTLGPATIRMRLESYGLDHDRDYHPFRTRPTAGLPLRELERALDLTPGSARPRGLAALVDGDLIGFTHHAPPPGIRLPVGLGPPARPARLAESFRVATRAMATAIAFGLDGAYDLPRLGLLPAVLSDAEVGAGLVDRYLTPLGTGAAAETVVDTLRAFFAYEMRVDRTAEALMLHPNTVRYRLSRFETLTGANLRDPGVALEVWWALRRAELDT